MTTIYEQVAQETRDSARKLYSSEQDLAVLSAAPSGTSIPMRDGLDFRAAIDETPAHLLLAVIAHLGADGGLLERARPHIRTIYEGGPQIPEALEREIRDTAARVLLSPENKEPPPLSVGRLKEIASVIVGEDVGHEAVPLLVDQMGFQAAGPFAPAPRQPAPVGYRIAVIGAGLSGLAAGIALGQAGYEYEIFEKTEEVGGVWWSNRYPGVAVDTPSHFYSYSFEINPDWPRYYSRGADLMIYWKSVADKYKLRDKIRFKTTVERCVWHEDTKKWQVTWSTDGVESEAEFDAVIAASGLFTHPKAPDIEGLDEFRGVAVHTASWDPEIDVAGKRVVQIGTGASGVQVGPEMATVADHLTVFQRTPPWMMIRPGRDTKTPLPDGFKWGLRHIPHLGTWMRLFTYWSASDGTHKLILMDPAWDGNDLAISAASEGMRQTMTLMLQQKLADRPDLFEKMLPDYPIFGKRLLQDSAWCETLMRDNVELVTAGVDRVVEDGVIDKEGRHHPADVLVLATGFAMARMMQNMAIVGRDGVQLRDVWGDEDPRSYLGTLVPGFPNFFLVNGPNAGATHGAGVNIYSEAQIHYILDLLEMTIEGGFSSMEVRQDAHDAYNEKLSEALDRTVWSHPRVNTYYKNSQGRNFVSCPWRILDMWHMFREPRPNDLILS